MQHDKDGLNHTYMNFVAHQWHTKRPLQTFANLHQYVLDCVHILDNTTPMVSPPRHAHHSDSFPSKSNSDDEVATLSAYLSNLGCDDNMLRHFEVFASQQQHRPPRWKQPRAPLNPATEIHHPLWGELPSNFCREWRKLPELQWFAVKDNFQSSTSTIRNKDIPTLRKLAYLAYIDPDLSDDDSSTVEDGYDTAYNSALQIYNATSSDVLIALTLHPIPSDQQDFDQGLSANSASAVVSASGSASPPKSKSIIFKQPKLLKKSQLPPGEPRCLLANKKFQLHTSENQLLGFVHGATPLMIQADHRAQ